MSKRENYPTKSDSSPEPKKTKFVGSEFQIQRMYRPAPDQKPNSPEPGSSYAHSDLSLQKEYKAEHEPIIHYFGPLQTEISSQTCTSTDLGDSTSDTTCNTSMETVGESQTTLYTVEDMDVDMDTIPESSRSSTSSISSTKEHRYRQCYRTHRSRRDQ